MRIIGGHYKGRRFNWKIPDGTRPTSDAVRENLFNVLANHLSPEGIVVADIFAGTGALGFEALSRGASFCLFIDKSTRAAEIIRKISHELALPQELYRIEVKDAARVLNSLPAVFPGLKFDLVFTDPPYFSQLNNKALFLIHEKNLANRGCILVAESSAREMILLPDGWEKIDERSSGDTKLEFVQFLG